MLGAFLERPLPKEAGRVWVALLTGAAQLICLGTPAHAAVDTMVTLAGKPRTGPMPPRAAGAEADFEAAYGATTHNAYGMCAMRHMHDYGTTSEQLAWIKVAASHHAQYNPHAMLKDVVTVEDVINSPMISDPLHRMDCCVVTDGGGVLVFATALGVLALSGAGLLSACSILKHAH